MKNSLLILFVMITGLSLQAQIKQTITVKAGTRIIDYFPAKERYTYTDFIQGKAEFGNKTYTAAKFNYNILLGEIQFIYKNDTLSIGNPESVKFVQIGTDTFYYDRGYYQVLANYGRLMLTVRKYVKFLDTGKESGYGTTSSTSAIRSYSNVIGGAGRSYGLQMHEDLILSKNTEYYIGNRKEGFLLYRKKSIEKLFPEKKTEIDTYIKLHHVDFNLQADLEDLTQYLEGL